jgi:hypothetical protein
MGSMRNRFAMSVAAVTLVSGAIVAITSESSAHAATTQCGTTCADFYNQEYGAADIVATASGTAGQQLTLDTAGEVSSEDFILHSFGALSGFYQAGLVSAAVDQAWANDKTYEFEYAPNGSDSGLCIGLGMNAYPGEAVTLEPCGVNANTVWIALAADQIGGYQPLVSANTSAINDPYVLTSQRSRFVLRGVGSILSLIVNSLSLVDGAFSASQMWSDEVGAIGHIVLP